MIKFFRHIRRSLINDNQMSKYFKYAIGEILLVVIGILLALQINNWNENRKLNNYEAQLLKQLEVDLQRNAKDLELNIILQNKVINSSALLLEHIEAKRPYHDSLSKHMANTVLWTKFIVSKGAYKTIESKGLDLITDLELRDLIFRIYEGNLNWLQEMEGIVINQMEGFRNNNASNYFKVLDPIKIKDNKYTDGKAVLINYEELLLDDNSSYTYYLSSIKNETEILLNISEGYLDDNRQGIAMIKSILNDSKND